MDGTLYLIFWVERHFHWDAESRPSSAVTTISSKRAGPTTSLLSKREALPNQLLVARALGSARAGHLGAETFDNLVCLVLCDLDELVVEITALRRD